SNIADSVADRFRTIFETLDQDFPETPKIVLSGAAFGTDLIAAETALQFDRNWAVSVILPFDRALFEEDFFPQSDVNLDQAWQDRLERYFRTFDRILGLAIESNPRVIVRELPKLSVEGGNIATFGQLSRHSKHYNKVLRRGHYEQVGQFIAELATIMIVVM